jgi:hypothetical protein
VTASQEEPSGRRGLVWLIVAMVALLALGLGIDQVASGFRTARRVGVAVEPGSVVHGSGLAFRCRDVRNCWWVYSVPAFRTWNVARVVDGEVASMGNLGPVSVASGTTIEVESRGDRLDFAVNGEHRRSIADGALRQARGAGPVIAAGSRARQAHWDDFGATGSGGTVEDGFDRPDAGELGRTGATPWQAVRGAWGIQGGQASLLESAASGWNLALTDVGTDATVAVTVWAGTPPSLVVDDFARPDTASGLGTATTGQRWHSRRGVWAVRDRAATVVRSSGQGFDLAVVRGGAADGTVEAELGTVRPGAGIAFRCRGPGNCWRLEAVPRFGTWNVVKVVRNRAVVLDNLGTVPVASGTTVRVEMDGPRLRFSVNGILQRSIRDVTHQTVAGVGLAVTTEPQAEGATWRSFRSTPAETAPETTP